MRKGCFGAAAPWCATTGKWSRKTVNWSLKNNMAERFSLPNCHSWHISLQITCVVLVTYEQKPWKVLINQILNKQIHLVWHSSRSAFFTVMNSFNRWINNVHKMSSNIWGVYDLWQTILKLFYQIDQVSKALFHICITLINFVLTCSNKSISITCNTFVFDVTLQTMLSTLWVTSLVYFMHFKSIKGWMLLYDMNQGYFVARWLIDRSMQNNAFIMW